MLLRLKSILTRKNLSASLGTPSFLRTNIKLPMLQSGKESLYFLPDVVLVVQGRSVGAVSYSHLIFVSTKTQFIEDGALPRDSQQVGTTWALREQIGRA